MDRATCLKVINIVQDIVYPHSGSVSNRATFKNIQTTAIKMAKKLGFAENFMLSGVAAAVSKTAAAPIERVKLLVQNQSEMIKQGTLSEPYKGVIDCTIKTFRSEGKIAFYLGMRGDPLTVFYAISQLIR